MRLASLSLLALVGCSAAPAPPQAPPDAPAPPPAASSVWTAVPPPVPCLPLHAEGSEILSTQLKGSVLTACFRSDPNSEPKPHPCLSFDLSSRAPTAASEVGDPEPPEDKPVPASPLTATDTAVRVCPDGSKRCTVIRPSNLSKYSAKLGHGGDNVGGLIAALSDDKKQVAMLLPERDPKSSADGSYRVAVETYDALSGKRSTRTVLPAGDSERPGLFYDGSDIWRVSWLGPRLKLSAYRCCGPAGAQAILDPKKGSLEPLGDPSLFEHIKGDTYLLGTEDSSGADPSVTLTFLHLDSGKHTRLKLPSKPRNEPETFVLAAHRLGPDRLLVVHANPPGVAWLDLDKETIAEQQKLPICQ